MKKSIILSVVLFAIVCLPAKAQHSVSLSKLIELANTSTLSAFDTKVRAMGYSFDSKDEEEKSTTSVYVKKATTKTLNLSFYLRYVDYGDKKPVISFIGSATALPGYFTQIKQQAKTLNFSETTDDCASDDDNTVAFCFKNKGYALLLYDTAIREEGNSYNTNRISVFKR